MSTKKTASKNVRMLCISAIMLALSTALSFVKIWEFPWGGSITLISMLPVMLGAIICGPAYGFGSAFVYSCIQLFLDLGKLSGWGLTPEIFAGAIFLDYLIPFTALGVASLFRGKKIAWKISGITLSLVIRYISHILSGVVLWHSAGLLWEGLEINNEWLYSIVYNGCYMLPEIILTFVASVFIFKNQAFSRIVTEEQNI